MPTTETSLTGQYLTGRRFARKGIDELRNPDMKLYSSYLSVKSINIFEKPNVWLNNYKFQSDFNFWIIFKNIVFEIQGRKMF
jgi:hypothetical protein